MGGPPKIGGNPQNRWFIMVNPIEMDDLGVPLILETPRCLVPLALGWGAQLQFCQYRLSWKFLVASFHEVLSLLVIFIDVTLTETNSKST